MSSRHQWVLRKFVNKYVLRIFFLRRGKIIDCAWIILTYSTGNFKRPYWEILCSTVRLSLFVCGYKFFWIDYGCQALCRLKKLSGKILNLCTRMKEEYQGCAPSSQSQPNREISQRATSIWLELQTFWLSHRNLL